MGQARTNRRIRKRMVKDNNHLSGQGIPRYARTRSAEARVKREALDKLKAARAGRSYGYKKRQG